MAEGSYQRICWGTIKKVLMEHMMYGSTMSELYRIADMMLVELQRLRKSGTPIATLTSYEEQIMSYLHEQLS